MLGAQTDMARQFNRRQIRAMIMEALRYPMMHDLPPDMFDPLPEEEPGDKYSRSSAAASRAIADTEEELEQLPGEMQGQRDAFLRYLQDIPQISEPERRSVAADIEPLLTIGHSRRSGR